MPIQTDLNVAPYYDDYQDSKDFYKVLFRPGVAVQARELNQMQTILQRQIERFGDNIFRRGTIIDGCFMLFHDVFPFVKIKDNQTDGAPVNVSQFEGLYIRNQANLQALVVTTISGYESRNPDLNTLYIQYINSGTSTTDTQFAADQLLTVFDPRESVAKVNVIDGSATFSNSDIVVFSSALAIVNSTGGTTFTTPFATNQVINNGITGGANAVIVSVDTTTNTEAVILRVRPLANNLVTSNAALWTFTANDSIINANTGQTAKLSYLVGSGASATIVTDSIGQVDFVAMSSGGSNYTVKPYVSVASKTANTARTAQANLDPQTFLTQITVANAATIPVGSGYGMTVGEGVIYQKGYFSRVAKQLVVVEKYYNPTSNPPKPDGKVVGFDTAEDIITSAVDPSLLDNAAGTFNAAAPGANRLKLSPELVVLSKEEADANSDFFAIAEFSEGRPYKQNRRTVYNKIGDEMAIRTFEESGNYVLNQFNATTNSVSTFTNEDTSFRLTVDPGTAYIDGYRVETMFNYNVEIDKGTNTITSNTATISMTYGSYVRVNELAGSFQFSTGDLVELYSNTVTYVSNTSTVGMTIAPVGTKIGEARIRSLALETGVPGTPAATYRMYLFDIKMVAGSNLKNVKSIYYNGTYDGICDTVQTIDASTGALETVLQESNRSAMTFYAGVDAIANIESVNYIYRSIDTTRVANTLGMLTKTVTDGIFPYTSGGVLSSGDKQDLLVIPLANAISTANLVGNYVTESGNAIVTGVGTQFLTDTQVGDWIRVANTSLANTVRQVASIANNTYLTLTKAAGATLSGNGTTYFPQNVPVNLDRSNRTANVSADGTVLTVSLGTNITNNTPVALAYNVRAQNTPFVTKTVNRDLYVRLNLANNAANTTGPWCLGLSDVFRLKGVFLGSNNTFSPSGTNVVDITNDYYIDHNQNENYYNTSYLYRKPTARDPISSASVLLVKLDAFTTTSEGLKHLRSYNVNDNVLLENNVTEINTLEIPEVYSSRGEYFDLRDCVDFRPVSSNIATVTSTPASATINPVEPSEAIRFSSQDKKFPAPDSDLTAKITYYQPRTDLVCVTSDANIRVIRGIPGQTTPPTTPQSALVITPLIVPPYPSLPQSLSPGMSAINDTRIANERYSARRRQRYSVRVPVTADQRSRLQPRGYKMTDIADLERRIRDLEYYVSFTLAEALVMRRTIPSGVTPNMERFKFGFFVDPFSDYSYSDIQNPEFNASILQDKLQPEYREVNLEFQFSFANSDINESVSGLVGTLPWTSHTLVSQLGATDGPVTVTPTPNTSDPVTPNTGGPTTPNTSIVNIVTTTTITQTETMTFVINTNQLTSKTGTVFEESEFKMSSLPGPVRLYLNFPDQDNNIEVFYGSTPGFSTEGLTPTYNSYSVVALTSTDRTLYAYGMGKLESLNPVELIAGKPTIEDAGKLLWTHDPQLGQYVKIRITKYRNSSGFLGGSGNKGKFFYRMYYPVDSIEQTTSTIVSPTQFVYEGTVANLTPDQFTVGTAYSFVGDYYWGGFSPPYISDSQEFGMIVTGLKPNTLHTFTFDNTNQSARCRPVGRKLGDQLVSNAEGILTFKYFYDAGLSETESDAQVFNALLGTIAGPKAFSVQSTDSTSRASGQVTIKNAIQAAINNGVTTTANTTSVSSSVVPENNTVYSGGGGGGGRDFNYFDNNVNLV